MNALQECVANQLARFIYSRYFNKGHDDTCTQKIVKELGYVMNDQTLTAPICDVVRDKLVVLLANRIYKVYITHHSKKTHVKFLYFDGTSEITEEYREFNRKIILKKKPESPWYQLSLVDLIKRYRLIENLKRIGFDYPNLQLP